VSAPSAITVQFWEYMATGENVNESTPFEIGDAGTPSNRCMTHCPYSDDNVYWDFGDIGGSGRISTSYAGHFDAWTHIALVSEGSGGAFKGIYFDGAVATSAASSDSPSSLSTLVIGAYFSGGTPMDTIKAKLDEMRISSVRRSAAWIAADYNSQKTSSTFIAWGALASTVGYFPQNCRHRQPNLRR